MSSTQRLQLHLTGRAPPAPGHTPVKAEHRACFLQQTGKHQHSNNLFFFFHVNPYQDELGFHIFILVYILH